MIVKLINCHIENFGKLHDLSIDFLAGKNMICHENGWGKTTFAAFLRAMFYGLEGERKRSLEENERKRYTPWQGGAFGGQITFEANGKRYIATRFFGEQEEFELRDADTNLISTDYSSNLGEELFRINRESFVRTVFIGQNDCKTSGTDDIHAKISNLTENTNDLNNCEEACELLTKLLNGMTPKRSTGSLARRKNEIARYERKVLEGEAIEKSIESYREYLRKEQARYGDSKQEMNELAEVQKRVSKMQAMAAQKEQWEELKDMCGKREQEMLRVRSYFGEQVPTQDIVEEMLRASKELRNMEEQHAKEQTMINTLQQEESGLKKKGKQQLLLIILGVILMIAFVLMQIISFEIGLTLGGVGAVLTVIGIITLGKVKSAQKQKKDDMQATQNHLDAIESEMEQLRNQVIAFLKQHGVNVQDEILDVHLYEMKTQISQYQYAIQLWQEAEGKVKEFENRTNISDLETFKQQEGIPSLDELNAKVLELNETLELTHKTIQNYNRNLEHLQLQYDEWEEDKQHLEVLKQLQQEETAKYRHLELTKKYLGLAKEAITTKFVGPLLEKFVLYYESIVGTMDKSFYMDANTELTFDEQGKQREEATLSSGYQDLAGICLRVALVDAMYTGEKPMLIMDDPFVNLDDNKMVAAKEFLKKIAEEYQIIYFTCSSIRV